MHELSIVANLFEILEKIAQLEREMLEAAEALEFERAAELRDREEALKTERDKGLST